MRTVLILALALSGCVGIAPPPGRPAGLAAIPTAGPSSPFSPAPEPTLAPTPKPTPKPTPVPTAAPPITFDGTGKDATAAFKVRAGVVIFDAQHQGDDNFIVKLLGEDGEAVDLVANEIGSYAGSRAFGLAAGSYVLDVAAGGPWSIKVLQPSAADAPDPLPYSGNGTIAKGPVRLGAGLTRFKMSHAGEGNFIVRLLNAQGEVEELLANEIGAFGGTKAVGLDGGVYFVDVRADGPWTIAVE